MKKAPSSFSRRERQIMEVIYREGRATVTDVLAKLPDPPGYSAVRALLRILEQKGHVRPLGGGTGYVFSRPFPAARARRFALRHLLQTFFQGSPEKAVAALLDMSRSELSEADLDRLSRLIDEAREEGR